MFLLVSVILYTRGVCYPSMHCRWYPSMPCSRSPGGCLLWGVSAPRGCVCSMGVLQGGCLLMGGVCSCWGVSAPEGCLLPGGCVCSGGCGLLTQAHIQGGNWGGSGPGPHPRGKLRGIRSRPTPKGEIEGDQVQAHTGLTVECWPLKAIICAYEIFLSTIHSKYSPQIFWLPTWPSQCYRNKCYII